MSEIGNNFVFIHIPRAGGHWVRECLQPLGTRPARPYHGIPKDETLEGKRIFTFIRHPAAWLRSMWGRFERYEWSSKGRFPYEKKLISVRSENFTEYASNITERYSGIIGAFFDEFMVPGIMIGKTEYLAEDLAKFVPGMDTNREKIQEGKNLPIIETEVKEKIERSESELMDRFYQCEVVR